MKCRTGGSNFSEHLTELSARLLTSSKSPSDVPRKRPAAGVLGQGQATFGWRIMGDLHRPPALRSRSD
jgi:hypothetical protein